MPLSKDIHCTRLSENLFSFTWKFKTDSNTIRCNLGSSCALFSNCFLEASSCFNSKTVGVLTEVIVFLSDPLVRSSPRMTFTARLLNKNGDEKSANKFELYESYRTKIFIREGVVMNVTYTIILNIELFRNSNGKDLSLRVKDTNSKFDCQRLSSTSIDEKAGTQLNPEYPEDLIQDLRSLFNTGLMSDINIRIGEDTLHAHKLILCARSLVFQKMVEHEFIESSSNCIKITDCELTVFKKFLKYLYTGEIGDRTTYTVMELYALADKYDVKGLRMSCSKILQSEFSSASVDHLAEIVPDVLQLAECQKDSTLKGLAMSFIFENFPEVSNKQSWKELLKSNSELTSEVLAEVAMALRKK